MLTWTRFADAVPAEARSVVTFGKGVGGGFLEYDGRSKRGDDVVEGWVSDLESVWHCVAIDDDNETWWREAASNRGWSHWAYADAPEGM